MIDIKAVTQEKAKVASLLLLSSNFWRIDMLPLKAIRRQNEFEICQFQDKNHPNLIHGPQEYLDAQPLDIFSKSVPIRNFKKLFYYYLSISQSCLIFQSYRTVSQKMRLPHPFQS